MKHALLALAFLAAAITAHAGNNVTLGWDDTNPVGVIQKYTIYEQTAPNVWSKVSDAPVSTGSAVQFTLQNVPTGVHTYAVTATSTWNLESVRSAPAIYATAIQQISNLKVIQVVVTP